MGKFFKRIGEFFEDQGGAKDAKLLLGFLMAIFGGVYIWRTHDVAAFVAIEGVSGALLGISALADQGKLGGPGGSNTTGQ